MTMSKDYSITIAILKHGSFSHLEKQLKNLNDIYNNLSESQKPRFEVLLSDNCSDDGSLKILKLFAKKYDWLSYTIHKKFISYDEHVLFVYCKAKNSYVWFCAIDDYIEKNAVQKIFKIIENESVSGILIGHEEISKQSKVLDIDRIYCSENRLHAILNSGKVSKNIIKKHNLNTSIKKSLNGLGYMHLTLQTLIQYYDKKLPLIKLRQNLIISSQSYGEKNSYHPKYACEVVDSMKINIVVNDTPSFFEKQKSAVIIKCKFLIKSIAHNTMRCWHNAFMCDFIYELFKQKNFKNYKKIEKFWIFIAALFLLYYPKFFIVIINGIFSIEKIYTEEDYRLDEKKI